MSEPQSVETLVSWARTGDRDAFEELFERYRDRVLDSLRGALRYRQGPAVDPEDILSETMLRAFRSLDSFEWQDEDAFVRWLFGISRNVRLESFRREKLSLSLAAAEQTASTEPSPSRALRRDERFDRLRRAIEALPDHYREVVYLARIEGLKTREVATRLGKSRDAVKHLLARALKLLRQQMGETDSLHLPDRRLGEAEGGHEE